jgi:hypothetical protein
MEAMHQRKMKPADGRRGFEGASHIAVCRNAETVDKCPYGRNCNYRHVRSGLDRLKRSDTKARDDNVRLSKELREGKVCSLRDHGFHNDDSDPLWDAIQLIINMKHGRQSGDEVSS